MASSQMAGAGVLPAYLGLRRGGAILTAPSPVPKPAAAAAAAKQCARRKPTRAALEFDSDSLVGIAAAVVGLAAGIGVPVFYEMSQKREAERGNTRPCFPCQGTGKQTCRFCSGEGKVIVDMGSGSTQSSSCISCDGSGEVSCAVCAGSGIQPRYLDRREFKDDD
eukprot:jgi/Chlat1/4722/Chrsp30S04768